ncbi:MAG: hypothetical protein B7Y80_03125 [Hyphomicrobium sp. 32-62-53]|nr:MAG: hypothetical protein B7Z29_07145 [Hyphomicrobium sp. 12-62-95]OYY00923.1 MAG: hypothetical protein B7Y80_03125 [Hyphomicrobium sp. 32-62-53]
MKRPNPLPPDKMSPAERRAELCGLLAVGLIRLQQRNRHQHSREYGEICLHCPAEESVHANPTHRRQA